MRAISMPPPAWFILVKMVLSGLLYAAALLSAALCIGVILVARREAFLTFDGHLRIGLGLALFCLGGGVFVANLEGSTYLSALGGACAIAGVMTWFFGRRRAREVNHFFRVLNKA